jgi:hypothetical protein
MLARVLSGDWFAHGIGGAKYDQMTDRIIERFFGLQPPYYQVVSGTLLLPINRDRGASVKLRETHRRIRDLEWNPDRYLETPDEATTERRCQCTRNEIERGVQEKQRWISTSPTPANARERFLAIRAANDALRNCVTGVRESLEAEARAAAKQARAEQILTSREYSFCLHREDQLRAFLLDT